MSLPELGTYVGVASGWRRFFSRSYWRWQWRCIRTGGRPRNIVAIHRLECPEGLRDLIVTVEDEP